MALPQVMERDLFFPGWERGGEGGGWWYICTGRGGVVGGSYSIYDASPEEEGIN